MNTTTKIAALTFAASIAIAGCGGVADTKTGSNGTGISAPSDPAVASGPLTGLGPVGLAGAQLDDASTQVLVNANALGNASELRLGMTANANGDTLGASGSGRAYGAVAQSLVVGPASAVDTIANRLSVLGMNVRADQNTLFEGAHSLADVLPGDQVEVFGLVLATSQNALATRIVIHKTATAGSAELLGTIGSIAGAAAVVEGISVSLANAQIGTTGSSGIAFSAATNVTTLTPGTLIRVIGTYDNATGVLTARTVAAGLAPSRPDGNLAFVEGCVRELVGAARFKLPDIEVDATGVPSVAGTIFIGTRIRARGVMQQGTLKADAIDIIQPTARTEFMIEGDIVAFTSAATFEVRGERIDATQATYQGGSAANLANGKRVRVKGTAGPGKLFASEVVFVN